MAEAHRWTCRNALLFLVVAAAGCAGGDPAGPGSESHELVDDGGHMAIVHYAGMDLTDPGTIEDFARADIVVVQMPYLWSPTTPPDLIDRMKLANPEVKVVGYVNAHAVRLEWAEIGDAHPFCRDSYELTRPHWSYSTAGDTMMSWPGAVLLDVLDPACRETMVSVLAEHWRSSANVPDGVYWDHFNDWLWVADVPGVQGEVDLDGDLVPHREDADEMEAYRGASEDLVRRLRLALGDRVIQIANGGRARRDSVFAGLLDGIMYEHFPDVNFRDGAMERILDMSTPDNIFAARRWPRRQNGGPWLILSNKFYAGYWTPDNSYQQIRLADLNRAVALVTGTHVAYHPPEQNTRYGWPDVPLDLGRPVAPAVRDGSLLRRQFERGTVLIDLDGGIGDIPFTYRIEGGAEIVQEFSGPADGS